MKTMNRRPIGFAIAEGGPDHDVRGSFASVRQGCDAFWAKRGQGPVKWNTRFGKTGFKQKGAK